MNKKWFWALGLSVIMAGCSEEKDYFQGNDASDGSELKPESEYFDFATTKDVTLNVSYGKYGNNALIELFTSDPFVYDENGNRSIADKAIYKVFADAQGNFNGKVTLPSYVKKVYIVSEKWGVPTCVEAAVENGQISYTAEQSVAAAAKATRAFNPDAKIISTVTNSEYNNFYALVNWNWYGGIIDDNGIVSYEEKISPADLKTLQYQLWKATTKPTDLDHSNLLRPTEVVNTRIFDTYQDENGEYKKCESAKITLTFLAERAGYQNVLGYYYYKTGETPASVKDVKKFIVVPNASTADDADPSYHEGNSVHGPALSPITLNTSFQLLFEKEDGTFTEDFPAGYTIGYFLLPKAFVPDGEGSGHYWSGRTKGSIQIQTDDAVKPIFSNSDWNPLYGGKRERFISVTAPDGSLVYGVEDGIDKSYEDVLFMISADPKGAITDEERPELPDPEPVFTTETTYYTYAFEDIWPDGGDYDLNDVIINHTRTATIAENNMVSIVRDEFTAVQPDDAAEYVDAFAVQFPAGGELNAAAVAENGSDSYIIFKHAMAERNMPVTISRAFSGEGVQKSVIDSEALNPYIVSQFEGVGVADRTEIHLPKEKVTPLADAQLIGSNDDAYFINKDNKHPFALKFKWTEAGQSFQPVNETVEIGIEYKKYDSWVANGCGDVDADWYLYYTPSK